MENEMKEQKKMGIVSKVLMGFVLLSLFVGTAFAGVATYEVVFSTFFATTTAGIDTTGFAPPAPSSSGSSGSSSTGGSSFYFPRPSYIPTPVQEPIIEPIVEPEPTPEPEPTVEQPEPIAEPIVEPEPITNPASQITEPITEQEHLEIPDWVKALIIPVVIGLVALCWIFFMGGGDQIIAYLNKAKPELKKA